MKKKYILYARTATQEQRTENANLKQQITELNKFAKRNKLKVIESIAETGSGMSISSGLINILARVYVGEVQGIICTDTNRLSRDGQTIVTLKEFMTKNNVELIILKK